MSIIGLIALGVIAITCVVLSIVFGDCEAEQTSDLCRRLNDLDKALKDSAEKIRQSNDDSKTWRKNADKN